MKHTLVALLHDQPGVLNRATSLFRRRGFNIESLTVGYSEQPHVSRMTLVVDGDQTSVDQVVKQLYKLIDVLDVQDVTETATTTRELLLIKVHAPATQQTHLRQLAESYGARIIDDSAETMLLECTNEPTTLDQLIERLQAYTIHEMVRTGSVAMVHGK